MTEGFRDDILDDFGLDTFAVHRQLARFDLIPRVVLTFAVRGGRVGHVLTPRPPRP